MSLPDYPTDVRAPEAFRRSADEPEFTARIEDYADLEAVLDAADEKGVLDVPAEEKQSALDGDANLVREPVIAERLWLLGYLKDSKVRASSSHQEEREEFLSAVEAFQRGAGIEVDRWSGDQTWNTLQRLVTFVDARTNVADYCDDGHPRPALIRATRLRLWSLGLEARKPNLRSKSEILPERALGKFWVIWGRFNKDDFGKPPPPTQQLIDHVFDQDHLLGCVAERNRAEEGSSGNRHVFTYFKRDSESRNRTDPEVESFLACLAKIELWLLGFDVDITHNRNYPVYNFDNSVQRRNKKLRAALTRFWEQLAPIDEAFEATLTNKQRRQRKDDRERLREHITPELFMALDDPDVWDKFSVTNARLQRSKIVSDEYSAEVAGELKSQKQIEATWTQGKSLGMKLWDGARRLWRWIKRGILKLIRIGRNLIRAFFRYSLKAFEIAKMSIRAVADSIPKYVTGDILKESPIHMDMELDADIEARIPEQATSNQIGDAANQLRHFGAAFHLSCRILAAIIRIMRTAAAGLIVGWARLLWLLVKSYRDLRPMYKELKALG